MPEREHQARRPRRHHLPFGELNRVKVVFPLIVSSSDSTSSYLTDGAQSWIDEIGAEPTPPDA
jgi:hypothetical protein